MWRRTVNKRQKKEMERKKERKKEGRDRSGGEGWKRIKCAMGTEQHGQMKTKCTTHQMTCIHNTVILKTAYCEKNISFFDKRRSIG